MRSAKDIIKEIVDQQPEDSSFDEILRELVCARMIQRGLEDSLAGRTIPDEELRRRTKTWRK